MRRVSFLALLAFAVPASAQPNLIAVALSGQTPPGSGTAVFTSGFTTGFPAIGPFGESAFTGSTSLGGGVYTGQGGPLTLIANTTTPIPDGGGATFSTFGTSTGYGAAGVAFRGTNAGNSLEGIYLSSGGALSTVANRTTPVPGGLVGNFTAFANAQQPAVSGANVAFRADFAGGSGLFARVDGSLVTIADTSMTMPGYTVPFTGLASSTSLSGNLAAFRGSGTPSGTFQGIFFRDLSNAANQMLMVTNRSQVLPGTESDPMPLTISGMDEPSIAGNSVYVSVTGGTGSARIAKYTWDGASSFSSSVLVKTGDDAPGTGTTFTDFAGAVPSDGNLVAFTGLFVNGGTKRGIFYSDGAAIHNVIDTTQLLDGKTISTLLMGQDGVSAGGITFNAAFTDGTRGVYFYPIPEPGLGLLVVSSAGLLFMNRNPRRKPRNAESTSACAEGYDGVAESTINCAHQSRSHLAASSAW